jgi:large subunit ribosomal protein L10
MRAEKKYLLTEVEKHLEKSPNYFYMLDYTKLNVLETKELRDQLTKDGAEFHVVKNSVLNVVLKKRGAPDMAEFLTGQVAIVVGGKNPAGVAKTLKTFGKAKEKLAIKVGIMDAKKMTKEEIEFLADLPSIEILRAQFLMLISEGAAKMVRLLDAKGKKA